MQKAREPPDCEVLDRCSWDCLGKEEKKKGEEKRFVRAALGHSSRHAASGGTISA